MSTVTHSVENSVCVIEVDDGKANALGHDAIAGINAGLDAALDSARAVAIVGREGKLSAGFDLGVMQSSPDAARTLLGEGADLFLRIFDFPQPVTIGCTGHALAAGAILLLSGDTRIGAQGSFKIGLNEVSIGMPVPVFATELARQRLDPRRLPIAIGEALVTDPEEAVITGFLDRTVPADDVRRAAVSHAETLASNLDPAAFAATRTILRGAAAADMRDRMHADIASFTISA